MPCSSLMLVAALSRAAALTPLALLPPARADWRWRCGWPARLERARRRLGLGARDRGRARPRRSWAGACAPRGAHERRRRFGDGGSGAPRDRGTDRRRRRRRATMWRDRRLVRTSHRAYVRLSKARARCLHALHQRLHSRSAVGFVHRLRPHGRGDCRLGDDERVRAAHCRGRARAAAGERAIPQGARWPGQSRRWAGELMRLVLPACGSRGSVGRAAPHAARIAAVWVKPPGVRQRSDRPFASAVARPLRLALGSPKRRCARRQHRHDLGAPLDRADRRLRLSIRGFRHCRTHNGRTPSVGTAGGTRRGSRRQPAPQRRIRDCRTRSMRRA